VENSIKRVNIARIIGEDIRLINRYKHTTFPAKSERYMLACDLATHYIVRTRAEDEQCSMISMVAILAAWRGKIHRLKANCRGIE
jgi:hypothetical protein